MPATIRADHIGSLQRPRELLDEVHRIYEAGHTALLDEERAKDRTHLHELEDEAIKKVVARQEELGLQVVTDGEFRRLMYFNSFFDAVDGLAPSQTRLQFRGDDGSVVEHEGPVAIVSRVSKRDSPAAREAEFVRGLTDRTVKVTFPTASFLVGQAALGPGIEAYGSTEEASEHLVGVLRELVDDAVAAGATYVQFDVSGYMMLSSSPLGQLVRARGVDLDALLEQMLEADRRIIAGLPQHVTTCMHQCRGNYASRYLADHDGLAELGETFFSLPYDRFTLEWDGHVERIRRRLRGARARPARRPDDLARRRQHAPPGHRVGRRHRRHRRASGAAPPARAAGDLAAVRVLVGADDGRRRPARRQPHRRGRPVAQARAARHHRGADLGLT